MKVLPQVIIVKIIRYFSSESEKKSYSFDMAENNEIMFFFFAPIPPLKLARSNNTINIGSMYCIDKKIITRKKRTKLEIQHRRIISLNVHSAVFNPHTILMKV